MKPRVAVVGGGIAGLACAYDLARSGAVEATLLEASRLGGKILSEREGGVVLEGGPDSFLSLKPWALDLALELGLERGLLNSRRSGQDVFLYSRGRMRRYPEGLMMLAPRPLPLLFSSILGPAQKLRLALEWFLPPGDAGEETLAQFCRRRFGSAALESVVAPILAGIYAGDPERLSLEATFPQLKELERRHGGVIRGVLARRPDKALSPWTTFVTLRGGMAELSRALAARLGSAAWTGARVASLARAGGGPYTLGLADGRSLEAETVVLALPADAACRLEGLSGALRAELGRVEFTSSATASFVYDARRWRRPPRGFGFVVDRREGLALSAGTYSADKFPGKVPPGRVLVRCFMAPLDKACCALSDPELLARAASDLRRVLPDAPEPESAKLYRWPSANPQYGPGHFSTLERLQALLEGESLVLAGASYRGVGIPDCVRSGRAAARLILGSGPRLERGAVV